MRCVLIIILLIFLSGCSSEISPCYAPPKSEIGNGVFVEEKATGRVGVIAGSESYYDWQPHSELLFTVKFTDGAVSTHYNHELSACKIQSRVCFPPPSN